MTENEGISADFTESMIDETNELLGTNFKAKLVGTNTVVVEGDYIKIEVNFDSEDPISSCLTEKVSEMIGKNFYQTDFHMEIAFLSAVSQAAKLLLSSEFLLDEIFPINDQNEGKC